MLHKCPLQLSSPSGQPFYINSQKIFEVRPSAPCTVSFCSRDSLLCMGLALTLHKQPSFTGRCYKPNSREDSGLLVRRCDGIFVTACIYSAVDGAAKQGSQGIRLHPYKVFKRQSPAHYRNQFKWISIQIPLIGLGRTSI